MINLRRKTYKTKFLCQQRAPSSDRFENLPQLKHNTKPTPPELCWRYRRGLVASIVCVTYIISQQCVHCARCESESVGVWYSAQPILQHIFCMYCTSPPSQPLLSCLALDKHSPCTFAFVCAQI